MNIALITGAGGLVGSESVEFFSKRSFKVIGVDNDMRKEFFGEEASTAWNVKRLKELYPDFENNNVDIRGQEAMFKLFSKYGRDIKVVIHAAAQPSHDWAAKAPFEDFAINANGTLNLLEATRQFCPQAVFIFTSTNKVYGDLPNFLPLEEKELRWEIKKDHPYFEGIDEAMSIDQSKHSLFGASKLAADILVQEYGRYFGLKTGIFRGGCLTGSLHSGTKLHGFLSYLMKCTMNGETYTIFGYKGKQVRDNIHSSDLVGAFYQFFLKPRAGEVYNIGGGRFSNCSVLEAIQVCEKIAEKKLKSVYSEENRIGDHVWYISSLKKFQSHYPQWRPKFSTEIILKEIYDKGAHRLSGQGRG